jgi:hypothetical protein
MASVLVDTGVWYALSDPNDRVAREVDLDALQARIEVHTIVIPWPIAYETLRTSFVRKRFALERFEQVLKSPRVIFIDDAPYRDDALEISLKSSLRGASSIEHGRLPYANPLGRYQREDSLPRHLQCARLCRRVY